MRCMPVYGEVSGAMARPRAGMTLGVGMQFLRAGGRVIFFFFFFLETRESAGWATRVMREAGYDDPWAGPGRGTARLCTTVALAGFKNKTKKNGGIGVRHDMLDMIVNAKQKTTSTCCSGKC